MRALYISDSNPPPACIYGGGASARPHLNADCALPDSGRKGNERDSTTTTML